MRCFIALRFNDDSIQQIEKLTHILKPMLPQQNVKWVKPENIHLTLHFFADISEQQVTLIQDALYEIAAGCTSFILSAQDVGFFPSKRNPHVIAIRTDIPPLFSLLIASLQKRLAQMGYQEERPFKSHITIARCHGHMKTHQVFPPFKAISMPMDRLVFLKSTLTSKGACYETIGEYPLAL